MPYNSDQDDLLQRIIGLGETSVRKSYYPELQQRLQDLERFHTLLDHSDDPIFTVEVPSGLIRDATASLAGLTGYPMDDLLKMSIFDFLSPLDAEKTRILITNDNLVDGKKERFMVWARSAYGKEIPLEIAASRLSFSGEDYVVIVAREISERIKAQKEIERQFNRISALHQIDLEITNYHEIGQILDTVIDLTRMNLGVDAVMISRFEPQTKSYRVLAWLGLERPEPFVNCLDTRTMGQDQWVWLDGAQNIRSRFCSQEMGELDRVETDVGVPLFMKEEPVGFFEVFYKEQRDISPDALAFLISLATQTAIAINSVELVSGLRATNFQLQMAYEATLEGWALALELREKETALHTRRVVEMTEKIAMAMGVSGEMLVNFRRGALLHDIGKMGVPDAILLKPGPLDEEEWKVMRQHPVYAYKMLEPIAFLRPVLDIPYAHHEHWDGSGYPRGLRGREIPLAARIFAIVDVWDALLSDRPYRSGWPPDKVYRYIREQAGKQFDPELVEVFFKVLEIVPVQQEF